MDLRTYIGIDLDNTIISYDHVFTAAASELGYRLPKGIRGKRQIRDAVRALPDGENKWQRLQHRVYAERVSEAVLADGVSAFLRTCGAQAVPYVIVSHKSAAGLSGGNQRQRCVAFLEAAGFFDPDGCNVPRDRLQFAETRAGKVRRFVTAGVTHVIDDLAETFTEDSFPTRTVRMLYDPYAESADWQGIRVYPSWEEISAYFFR